MHIQYMYRILHVLVGTDIKQSLNHSYKIHKESFAPISRCYDGMMVL